VFNEYTQWVNLLLRDCVSSFLSKRKAVARLLKSASGIYCKLLIWSRILVVTLQINLVLGTAFGHRNGSSNEWSARFGNFADFRSLIGSNNSAANFFLAIDRIMGFFCFYILKATMLRTEIIPNNMFNGKHYT